MPPAREDFRSNRNEGWSLSELFNSYFLPSYFLRESATARNCSAVSDFDIERRALDVRRFSGPAVTPLPSRLVGP
jgi:hypothetical protein